MNIFHHHHPYGISHSKISKRRVQGYFSHQRAALMVFTSPNMLEHQVAKCWKHYSVCMMFTITGGRWNESKIYFGGHLMRWHLNTLKNSLIWKKIGALRAKLNIKMNKQLIRTEFVFCTKWKTNHSKQKHDVVSLPKKLFVIDLYVLSCCIWIMVMLRKIQNNSYVQWHFGKYYIRNLNWNNKKRNRNKALSNIALLWVTLNKKITIHSMLLLKCGNSPGVHRVDELLTFFPTHVVLLYLKQTEGILCWATEGACNHICMHNHPLTQKKQKTIKKIEVKLFPNHSLVKYKSG